MNFNGWMVLPSCKQDEHKEDHSTYINLFSSITFWKIYTSLIHCIPGGLGVSTVNRLEREFLDAMVSFLNNLICLVILSLKFSITKNSMLCPPYQVAFN